jgi:hypothetical protein
MKKLVKIVGLCLASMLVVGMVLASSASAFKWEQCGEGGSNTKYEGHQCLNISSNSAENKWSWKEAPGTEKVKIKGTLFLADTKTLAGESEVECFGGEAEGVAGPGNLGKIEKVTIEGKTECRPLKVCENVEKVEARNLPWQTEAYETEGKILEKLGPDGAGHPGWSVKCKTLLGSKTDECVEEENKPESLVLTNKVTPRSGSVELLVLATFQHLRKAKCTEGGAESGRVEGSVGVLKVNGWALRVTK